MMNSYLGWDIGGTKSSAVVADAEGRVVGKRTWASESARGPHAMCDDFLHAAEELRADFPEIMAVGVSVGGPLDPLNGVVYSPPHLPGWDAWPLRDRLGEHLNLPVVVEHDAAACLLAEHLWGCARDTGHAAYLTAGTGCGAAVLNDGRILRGPGGQSTEIGHVRIAEDGPDVYGKRGSVESYCSGTGIALLAVEMFPERYPRPVPARELVGLAAAGDVCAERVLRKSADAMGRVCALLSDLFAPELLIIGSLAMYLPDWWLDTVTDQWARETLARHRQSATVCGSRLRERLQDLSAVAPCVFAERNRGFDNNNE